MLLPVPGYADVAAETVDDIIQNPAVAAHDNLLRGADIGINGVLRLLPDSRLLTAGRLQQADICHAVDAEQAGLRDIIRDADEVVMLVEVGHFVGADGVAVGDVLLFIQPVVQVIHLHLFLSGDGLIQLLDVPKDLPVIGFVLLPGDGQVAVFFALVAA